MVEQPVLQLLRVDFVIRVKHVRDVIDELGEETEVRILLFCIVLPTPSLLLRLNIRPSSVSEIFSEEDSEDFVTDLSSCLRVEI